MNVFIAQPAINAEVVPLISAACPLCGNQQQRAFLSAPDRLHHLPGQWTLVQCTQCSFVYQSPRVADNEIDRLYPATYEPFQTAVSDDGYIGRELRQTAAFVDRHGSGSRRLLDVGCGAGDFLLVMRRLYSAWQTLGVEPNAVAVTRAVARGLDVRQGTLDDVPASGTYDMITLWNVLEHLPEPLLFLKAIRERLVPNGTLCLAVPVHDSWEAQFFGKYWVGWELPRHMLAFNRQSIVALLDAAGFAPVEQACISGVYYGFVQSVLLAVEDQSSSWVMRRFIETLLFSRPMRVLMKPYVLLAERFNRGTVLTIAARRIEDVRV